MKTTELWTFRDQAVTRIDLRGFELQALDGALGKVAESIEGSGGGYLVVDPGVGRQLLIPAGLIEKVDVDNRRVLVRAGREQIRNAPEYEPSQPLDERSRTGFGDYYRPLMAPAGGQARAGRAPARGSTRPQPRKSGRGRARPESSRRAARRRRAAGPTKAELYAQARRLGIEGRSKMNKSQLARAVGRRRARQTGAARSGAKATPVEVQAFLEGVGYPTRKGQLLREAESQGAGRDVRATLRRLPDKTFSSPTEVSEAVGRLG